MPSTLLALAKDEGIKLEWWSFTPPLEAVYWSTPNLPPIIGLSYLLKQSSRAYFRCILAEEIGHHFTTSCNALPQTLFHYRNRVKVSSAEFKALKWAALYLLPLDNLLHSLKHGASKKRELAKEFNVTEKIVDFRLNLLDLKIQDKKQIIYS